MNTKYSFNKFFRIISFNLLSLSFFSFPSINSEPYSADFKPFDNISFPKKEYYKYGPLKINLNISYKQDGMIIYPALNYQSKKIYIAFNCHAELLNVTSSNLMWKDWAKPQLPFESRMIRDICSQNTLIID